MAGRILVTGGCGYIGSHTVVELLQLDREVVVIDNLINSSEESLKRVMEITGKKVDFVNVDLRNAGDVRAVFERFPDITSVIHFAGLKAVGESNKIPLKYYDHNIRGTLNLLEIMAERNCKNLIFSSSATVYGVPERLPLNESHPLSATNPYGRTKLMIEDILRDVCKSDETWKVVLLRYFNPTGAHESGRIGEDPQGPPNNLMPFVAQVAIGRRAEVSVFGSDYETVDGTGVRDYIHVVDLAQGHVAALNRLDRSGVKGCEVYNLGTGEGYSVLQMIAAFSKASGREIKYTVGPRRAGDVAACYADATQARTELGWTATRGLEKMCEDMWRWQVNNPNGFAQ